MKIDQNKKNLNQFHTLPNTDVHEVRRGSESLFDEELTQRQDDFLQYKMRELLSEIDKTTEKLKKTISIRDLMIYKKLVKNFLKEASSQAYQVETRRSRSRRGRTIMITVKTIDEEIENVIQDFMKKKSEPMDILTALDKIRGMLVDLLI